VPPFSIHQHFNDHATDEARHRGNRI
jgi:hypothetical protein